MKDVKTIGDPHLGRHFKNGVPLNRRGEREKQVWAEFERQLNDVARMDLVVVMGDLFDQFIVPPDVELEAARLVIEAALAHPHVHYVILRGNHDAVREAGRKSSFDVFFELVVHVPNIHVAKEWPKAIGGRLFVPWHPFKNADEMLASVVEDGIKYSAVFGHWDIESFGGADSNLIPYEKLSKITSVVFTGHVHKPSRFECMGLDVTVTGSMLPYAHGEEDEDDQYRTFTLEEYAAVNPEDVRDKNVRILLKPGEKLPANIDALQVTAKRVDDEGNEDAAEVSIEGFDFGRIYGEVMTEYSVSISVQNEIWDSYESTKASRNAA